MNPNEHWLLDSVLEQRHPMAMLTMDNCEAIFDRPAHGMDRETLIATLTRLFELKLLNATNDDRGEFTPTSTEIVKALDSEMDADYGLTEMGGAVWAEVAVPDWNRYVDGTFGEVDEENEFESMGPAIPSMRRRKPGLRMGGERVGEFFCADKNYLERFIESIHFRGIAPYMPSLKWEVISPWQALYWKELPSAHSVRFVGVYAAECPEELIPEEFHGMGIWRTGASAIQS